MLYKILPPMQLAQAKTVNPKKTEFIPVKIWISYTKLIKTEHTTVKADIETKKE